jgi:hypothetical protein
VWHGHRKWTKNASLHPARFRIAVVENLVAYLAAQLRVEMKDDDVLDFANVQDVLPIGGAYGKMDVQHNPVSPRWVVFLYPRSQW